MRIDSLVLRMRPRSPYESADLGVRLCQREARSVYRCYLAVAIPVVALSLASFEIAGWLPGVLLWWAKPWLDRTILFVLSRAAFGQATTLGDLWRAQWQVWWQQLLLTLTWRRLSPWRSFTQPVYQLEGLGFLKRGKRVRQLRRRWTTPAALMTSAFSFAETALAFAIGSLAFWFAPGDNTIDLSMLLSGNLPVFLSLLMAVSYGIVVLFLEPFYVAAGFTMYLSRRAELEAWDIEQELRRAFAV